MACVTQHHLSQFEDKRCSWSITPKNYYFFFAVFFTYAGR